MLKKIGSWIIDKWLAGFITGILIFLLKVYYDLPSEQKEHFFNFHWISNLLNEEVKVKYFLIIAILLLVFSRIEKHLYIKRYEEENDDYSFLTPEKIDFGNYTQDSFGQRNSKWSWKYIWQPYERKYKIDDLTPLCPTCNNKTTIVRSYYGESSDCHKCRLSGKKSTFSLTEEIADIEKEIIDRIQKGKKLNTI